ncbi:MAG: alpha-amylase family glycosyl hydrolase, partial [Eubacteriales bacterium]|nr:alpha-amylase family glycosyl hydrolase [Eubacteriales bacterium]
NFNIEQNSWNALGTKSQFEAMCNEAHKYGVKVIVDTVFNHMANDSSENSINPQIPSDIRDDSSCWYSVDWNCSNWEDRYDVTHNCLSGFPDLNTSSSKVQSYCISFLKECIDAGADGFRFDAAKHIETPSDAYGTSSDFWPNVLNTATYHAQQTRGITPYYYGEILGAPGGGLSISAYTDYMSVTDSSTGNNIRNAIASGNASGACISGIGNGAAPSKTVQWNESHDTYYADRDSMWISNENMKKTWAIVGSRAEVCGLYLARPENNDTTMLGDGDITAWADKEVKAINKFKNYFAGHPEYLASSGNIVYNERGNTGVVLVNVTGGSTSVSVPAHRMWDGTYTDAITGNHFNVSNGKISGQIGSSGIAVVYSYPSDVSISERSQKFRTDEIGITATYTEATGGTYTIGTDYSKSYSSGDRIYVGCGLEYGESVDLEVSASGGTTTDTEIATFTKMHPDTDLRIFFDNSVPYWENVYVYLYDESGDYDVAWPGTKLTYDSSYDAYVYEVPDGFETCSVIFNDGADNQVGPYSFDGYTSKWSDNSFYGYNTGITSKLYFKPSEKWKSDKARFAAYIWTGSTNTWVNFSDSDGDGIYSAALPSGTWKNAIFARMNPASSTNNWDNIWNQTGDMGLSNNHNYFMIADGWDTSSGTWSIINESIVGTDSDAYITGSFNAWDTTASPMVYTKYNEAKTTLNIPAGTYTFKLYKGGNWFSNPGTINDTTAGIGWSMCRNDSQNCTLVASKAGEYTFTLNTETLKVTVDYDESDVEPTQVPTYETEPPTEEPTEEPTIPPTDPPTEAPLCEAGYYLVGTLNGVDCWGVESLTEDRMLASNPGNSGEYMLNYTFVEGDEIKVAYCDGYEITKWYGSGDNYSIGSSKAGSGTLYFRPEGNSSWSYTYFTVIKNTVQETVPPTDPPTEESTEPETEKPTDAPTEAPTVKTLPSGYYVVGTLNGADCWGIDTL